MLLGVCRGCSLPQTFLGLAGCSFSKPNHLKGALSLPVASACLNYAFALKALSA